MTSDQFQQLIDALDAAAAVLRDPTAPPAKREKTAGFCQLTKLTVEACALKHSACAGVNHG